jgi:hypothetical protein
MCSIGQIVGVPDSVGIDRNKWIALIGSHRLLGPVLARKGINPFTGKPVEFKAPPTSAIITIDGKGVGNITWAEDGSPMLIVQTGDGVEDSVARVATDVAIALNGQFVRNPDY